MADSCRLLNWDLFSPLANGVAIPPGKIQMTKTVLEFV